MQIINILNDDGDYIVRFESSEGKLVNLENAHFLNSRLFSNPLSYTNNQFNSACQKLFSKLDIKGKKLDTKLVSLKNVLSNLLIAESKNKVVSYYRAKKYYASNTKIGLEHFTYDIVIRVIDSLINQGYAEGVTGNYNRIQDTGKISRIWPTKRVIQFMNESDFITAADDEIISNVYYSENAYNVLQPKFRQIDLDNVIIVNDGISKYKPKINNYVSTSISCLLEYNTYMNEQAVWLINNTTDYSITSTTTSINKNIHEHIQYTYSGTPTIINQIASTDIEDSISVPTTITSTKSRIPFIYRPSDTFCYRVYNNAKLTYGGRFYGTSYQGESQKARSGILINGFETVEIDYSAYHLGMLYNLENMSVSNDAYDLYGDNQLLRKSVKLMFNMLLNSKNKQIAISAFNWKLNQKYSNPEKQQKMLDINSELKKNSIKAKDILQKIEDNHPTISKYFNTGFGRNLQRMDSDIANGIMNRMIKLDVPCLVIHDSFIVPNNHADKLESIMRDEYKKKFNYDCKLAKK